ncbi:MAG: type II toxin-antitoxin system VapC family toxin [Caulobacter sp.]|nr:type II toxin-antitoxin system VapC family toxin [Caulobacter sp.]
MIGWLLDTNVVASLIAVGGAPSVKAWAAAQDENRLFLSILTLGEIEKSIHNLPDDDPSRTRYLLSLALLEDRFRGRILSVGDPVVRRWGRLSGAIKRSSGIAPSVVDTLLAATALEHDLHLVTRNVRDVIGSGASVFNPWTDKANDFHLAPAPRGR